VRGRCRLETPEVPGRDTEGMSGSGDDRWIPTVDFGQLLGCAHDALHAPLIARPPRDPDQPSGRARLLEQQATVAREQIERGFCGPIAEEVRSLGIAKAKRGPLSVRRTERQSCSEIVCTPRLDVVRGVAQLTAQHRCGDENVAGDRADHRRAETCGQLKARLGRLSRGVESAGDEIDSG
jgi:hypothetical protein